MSTMTTMSTLMVTTEGTPYAIVLDPCLPWEAADARFEHVNVHIEAMDGYTSVSDLAAELHRVLTEGGTFIASWVHNDPTEALLLAGFSEVRSERVGLMMVTRGAR